MCLFMRARKMTPIARAGAGRLAVLLVYIAGAADVCLNAPCREGAPLWCAVRTSLRRLTRVVTAFGSRTARALLVVEGRGDEDRTHQSLGRWSELYTRAGDDLLGVLEDDSRRGGFLLSARLLSSALL